MASLKNIDTMTQTLMSKGFKYEETCPPWVKGYSKRENHLSGALREAAMNWSHLPREVEALLDEAAETLDDAHEEWLEDKLEQWERLQCQIGL